jgi:hypothetical protein
MKTIAWGILVAALVCGAGCARPDWIEQTLVTVDVTGVWEGTLTGTSGANVSNFWCSFNLEQQGSRVKGSVARCASTILDRAGGSIEGTVAGDVFSFRQTNGSLTGEITVSGDDMTGPVQNVLGRGTLTLRRVGSSSRPNSP